MNPTSLTHTSLQFILFAPLVVLVFLGVFKLCGGRLGEKKIHRFISAITLLNFLFALASATIFFVFIRSPLEMHQGWLYRSSFINLELRFIYDTVSALLLIVMTFVTGIVGSFSERYLHRDPRYFSFFVLYLLFIVGINTLVLAGSFEMVVVGWEFIGVSSVLLIGYFSQRVSAVENSFLTLTCYKLCDMGLLLAMILWHHILGHGEVFVTTKPLVVTPENHYLVNLLAFALLLAAFGKAAQLPFSFWLRRAMEGPTPSSAIFYGAVSIHTGCYLLLRMAPVLKIVPAAAATLVVVGLATAFHAWFSGRVRSDVKTQLSYATLTQVGLIMAEIGLGFTTFALVHMLGHSVLRTIQFLGASSVIQLSKNLGTNADSKLTRFERSLAKRMPEGVKLWFYRQSLMGWNLEATTRALLLGPLLALSRFSEKIDKGLQRFWYALAPRFLRQDDTGSRWISATGCDNQENLRPPHWQGSS